MESCWSQVVLELSQICNTAATWLKPRLTGDQGTEQLAALRNSFHLKKRAWCCSLTNAAWEAALADGVHIQSSMNKSKSLLICSPYPTIPPTAWKPKENPVQRKKHKHFFWGGHILGMAQQWQGTKSAAADCPALLGVNIGRNLVSQESP